MAAKKFNRFFSEPCSTLPHNFVKIRLQVFEQFSRQAERRKRTNLITYIVLSAPVIKLGLIASNAWGIVRGR